MKTPSASSRQATGKPPKRRITALRAAPAVYSDDQVKVDPANGIIFNVALMSVGPAEGHGFDIDQTTIEQLVALAGQQSDGVKSRFKHPPIKESKQPDGSIKQTVGDDTGTRVGRIKNVRVVGEQARGDVHLGDYASNIPGLGDVRTYLLTHAATDPAGIGMSAMFSFDVEPQLDADGNVISLPARLFSLDAIDFVGEPAANPNGLLSARVTQPLAAGGLGGEASPNSGWADPHPATPANWITPIPAGTPDFDQDSRGLFLRTLVKHGPLNFGGIAARSGFNGRLLAVRSACDWLVTGGFATQLGDGRYSATPRGTTQCALCWK